MSENSVESAAVLPVVTLFESYGSGAEEVGRKVAERLGLPYHEQAFSSAQIEQETASREKRSELGRVMTALGGRGHGGLIGDLGGGVSEAQQDEYELVNSNTQTVRAYATEGGVILGRNGALILKDHPAALHVRLDGPVEARVARAAAGSGISAQQAAKRQKREDVLRAEMSQRLYGWDPREIAYYDLVLNTGQLDLDLAAEIITQAVRTKTGA